MNPNGIEFTLSQTLTAFDTNVLINRERLFLLAFGGANRTDLSAKAAALTEVFNHGKGNQRTAGFGRTVLIDDVGLVFVSKVFKSGQNRIGSGLS